MCIRDSYKIKAQNDSEFVSMATDAGADVNRGVWAGGVNYEKGKFNIGAIDYYSQDIINIAYAQGGFEVPLADDWKLRFAGQYVDQGSVGDNELQGHSFSGHQFGLSLIHISEPTRLLSISYAVFCLKKK